MYSTIEISKLKGAPAFVTDAVDAFFIEYRICWGLLLKNSRSLEVMGLLTVEGYIFDSLNFVMQVKIYKEYPAVSDSLI